MLLRYGADPNQRNQNGTVPLYFLMDRWNRHRDPEFVLQMLIDAGVDVNAPLSTKYAAQETALEKAASAGHILQSNLVDAGAKICLPETNYSYRKIMGVIAPYAKEAKERAEAKARKQAQNAIQNAWKSQVRCIRCFFPVKQAQMRLCGRFKA